MTPTSHRNPLPSPDPLRRRLLQSAAGLLFSASGARLWGAETSPRAARDGAKTHHPAGARNVIFLYMSGGYSHVDTFDPKPRLTRDHDQPLDGRDVKGARYLKAPLWKFQPNRRCGAEVSDLFPHLRERMDDVCLIRSMYCDNREHGEATLQLHTGSGGATMPSLGAWLSYGLGSANASLPSHVVLAKDLPYAGAQVWDNSFLPAAHQGVRVLPGAEPIENLRPAVALQQQRRELDLLRELNAASDARYFDAELRAGRAAAFDAAYALQRAAPEALDLSQETEATLKLYGVDADQPASYAAQCLMARRLVERGVRFVEVIDAVGACRDNWDSAHRDMADHAKYAKQVDQPVAALLADLKRTGLLDETLVVFCTEFGRTPWAQEGKGTKSRNHHPEAFSCWLAGGGVRGGVVHGATDDIGYRVIEDGVHIHDFHATILHIMGFDHTRLTYRYSGRDFRLTDVHGEVVREILS